MVNAASGGLITAASGGAFQVNGEDMTKVTGLIEKGGMKLGEFNVNTADYLLGKSGAAGEKIGLWLHEQLRESK